MDFKKLSKRMAVVLIIMIMAITVFYFSTPGQIAAADIARIDFKEGDVIFQISASSQSLAIQAATGSKYSHCGILFKRDGQFYVYEAIGEVSWTPLRDWINRGVRGHYVVMRLKDRDRLLTEARIRAMKKTGLGFSRKKYDLLFQWSDNKMYCSELVWKIYERGAGIRIAPLKEFRDYNLDNKVVRAVVKKRYGGKLPMGEKVVAPSDLFYSPVMEKIAGN
ncbi:hypothetical protein C4J81_14045 [Deltaproteobacteria bacterium Smac51]|nr:hypothetical protein C4J81_14045 [Deltaproteobacteria bacterium Smac51]